MPHAFRDFLQQGLDDRTWRQADLVRESGMSRALVSKLLKDQRDVLPRPPEQATVEGIAKAFRVPPATVWQVVARAMGLPTEALPTIVHELKDATDHELLDEISQRMSRRVVSDQEWAAERRRADELEILEFISRQNEAESGATVVDAENPFPVDTLAWRRIEEERQKQLRLDAMVDEYLERRGTASITFTARGQVNSARELEPDELARRRAAAEAETSIEGPEPPAELAADATDEDTEYTKQFDAEHGDDNEGR
ncbi:hypothetical protein HMPREF0063_11950 [Aeromicrobium marinum DSM 15272]|uniref:HTH cro/C1-type domain-containing protein n=1 Tax=Aeromicrobium marinum DSM 15272 TaxID=585531 RepID=E2SE14_9ACTN|nr:hypothetical protein HMPREF0063_11950 [Aeromicrobium marinum DSM 15272]